MSRTREAAIAAGWCLFLLVLPFGEGGASPEGLFAAHIALLAAVALSVPVVVGTLDRSLAVGALAVLAAGAVSTAFSPYRFASLLAMTDLAALLGALVIGEALLRQRPGLRRFVLGTIVVSAAMQAIVILTRWGSGGSAAPGPGTLLNSNHAAAYIATGLWCLIALGGSAGADRTRSANVSIARWRRIGESLARPAGRPGARACVGALLATAALLQASRGALMGAVAGGCVYLALSWRGMTPRTRRLAGIVCAGILILAICLLARRLAMRQDPYLWDRVPIWRCALRIAREHPFLGIGPGVFPHASAAFDVAHTEGPVHYAKHVEATHSDLLRVPAEMGLLGVVAFVGLLLVVGRRGLGAVRRSPGTSQAALAAAVVGLLVQCGVENLSFRPAVSYTGALAAAALAGADARKRALARGEDEAAAVRSICIHGAIAWAAIVLVIAPYLGYRAFRLYSQRAGRVGEHYRSAIFWNPLQPDYRAALAEAVLAAPRATPDDLRAGLLAIDEAIALKPIDSRLELLKARLASEAFLTGGGETSWITMAEECYRRAIGLDPHRPQARLELGWTLIRVRRFESALELAEAALTSEPNSFEARRLRAASLVGLDRIAEARAELVESVRRHRSLSGYAPANPYEAQVLAWSVGGFAELEGRLGPSEEAGEQGPD